MKLTPLLLGLVFLFSSTLSVAQNSDDYSYTSSYTSTYSAVEAEKNRHIQESTGIISGAIIGGIIAGPPGVIVTSAFGALLGNFFSGSTDRKNLQVALARGKQDYLALETRNRELEEQYQLALIRPANTGLLPASFGRVTTINSIECCTDSEISLHFKTNSSSIEQLYSEPLKKLAELSKRFPEAIIGITGHADRRGGNSSNLALSQRRVQSVENALTALGVNNTTIQTVAFGENRPVESTESVEGNFYDRRVIVTIRSLNNNFLTDTDR